MRPNEKALSGREAALSRCAMGFAALLLVAACDRPLAQPAMAAETLAARTNDAAKSATAPPSPAPAPAPAPAQAPAPAADPLSDAAITERVTSSIRDDPALAGTDVSVNTSHGVVSLTGMVKSPQQVAEVEARAQAPDGVMRIDSHLAVNPP
jgi:hyperosmotically inducible protein